MEENNKNYIITLSSGQRAQLSEEEYNERKDAIFSKDKDAQVARINQFNPEDEIDDNSFYSVGLPDGKLAVLSADEYRQRADKLRSVEGIQIGSVSPVDYWGDKLNGLNTQIGEIEDRLKANKAIYNTRMTNQQAIDVERSKIEDSKALEALKTERENNPAWQSAKQKQIDNLQAESDRIDNEIRGLDTIYPGAREQSEKVFMLDRPGVPMSSEISKMNPEYERDSMALTAAKMYYSDALKAAKAPSRYGNETGFGNFFRGLAGNAGEALSLTSLVKAGISTALIDTVKDVQEKNGENTNFIELVQNPEQMKELGLSAAQQEVLKAFVVKSAVDAERSEDMYLGYQAGKSAVQSLGFMTDFMLFGGAPETLLKKATQKYLIAPIAKAGLKGVTRQAAKFGVGTLQGAVKTLLMTPAMPSSWANFTQNLASMNEAGQVDMSGKAILRDVGDVLIENFSENAGKQIETLIGSPAKLGARLFADTKFGDWAKAVSNTPTVQFLKQGGWNGLFGEIGEEWYGNALRVMTGVDKDALKDFATVDQQIITLASFAPITLLGGGASSAQFLAAKKQMNNASNVLSNLLEREGYDKETIANILDASKEETPADISAKLTPVVNQIARDNGDGSLAYTAAMDYARAISRYRAFEGSRLVDTDEKRNAMEQDILNKLGRDYEYKIAAENDGVTYTGSRVRAIDVDGKRGYLVAQDGNGNYSVNYNDGSVGFITEDAIKQGVEDGSMQDTGWISREDYLDMELTARKDGEQRQRMDNEYRARIDEIRQRALPGVQINIGTEESPVIATIIGWNGEKFVVESAERGAEEFDINQMAGALDVNMHVETDEEIENKQADEIISNEDFISKVNAAKGMPVNFNGQEFIFDTAFNPHQDESGNWLVDVIPESDDLPEAVEIPISELRAAYEQFAPVMAEAENAAEAEKTAEVSAEETVEDNIPRDFRGNPLPLKTDGSVNQTELWNKDPEAWTKWNDSNPYSRINSQVYVQGRIDALTGDIKKLEKAIEKETKTTGDFDKIEELAQQIDVKRQRQGELQSIIDGYRKAEELQLEAEKQREIELSQPQNISQLAVMVLDGVKARSLDRDSFKRELGWGNKELSQFFPWWAKKGTGKTLDALSEEMAELDGEYGFLPMDANAEQKDTLAAKDALIQVLQEISRPGELRNQILNENKAFEEAQKNAEEAAIEQEIMEKYGVTKAEYDAMSDAEKANLEENAAPAAVEQSISEPIAKDKDGNELAVGDVIAVRGYNGEKTITKIKQTVFNGQPATNVYFEEDGKTWSENIPKKIKLIKKNSVLDNTTDTGETLSSEQNDTATLQNTVSESKDTQIPETANVPVENVAENQEVPVSEGPSREQLVEQVVAYLREAGTDESDINAIISATDDELMQFVSLWENWVPVNERYGEVQEKYGKDLNSKDEAKKKKAKNAIAKAQKDGIDAFAPVQDLFDSLIAKYGVNTMSQEQNAQKHDSKGQYGANNKIVTTERYEELKKRMLAKLNNLNAGFDGETLAIGCEMAAYHIEAGARKFIDFAKQMIDDLGDAIKPYLKSIYNGARDLPGMEEYASEMDSYEDVVKAEVNNIGLVDTPEFNEGDLVIYQSRSMKVAGVHPKTLDLVYDPTGFMPVYSMGVPVADVTKFASFHTEDISNSVEAARQEVNTEPTESHGKSARA